MKIPRRNEKTKFLRRAVQDAAEIALTMPVPAMSLLNIVKDVLPEYGIKVPTGLDEMIRFVQNGQPIDVDMVNNVNRNIR